MLVLAAVVANIAAVATFAGGEAATALGIGWLILLAGVVVALPRAAHAAFAGGRYDAAAWRYRLMGTVAVERSRRAAAWISVAACHLARGDHRRGAAVLDGIEPTALDGVGRAAWLNNRAYAALRGGLGDPALAMAWAEEAVSARPDVPGLQHTLGLALLATGKVDEAIRAFDDMWSAGDLAPRLEAERCLDLARAWEQKGHADYAADYRARAARTFPGLPGAGDAPLPTGTFDEDSP
jgi:tetratricopeptide (TPR) repeat protein